MYHPAVKEYRNICNGCLADITGNEAAHTENAMLNGNYACGGWHGEWVIISNEYNEQVLVQNAYDETVATGRYTCACGAMK